MIANKATILIAEDDDDLRKVLAFDFKRLGFNVLEASGGKTALNLVQSETVDVIISDISMPDGDGIELLKTLRSVDRKKPIVLMMTGYTNVTNTEVMDMGADAFISKPFDRKDLLSIVQSKLTGK